jgi:myo-inositol-1(or 4)-monophosphatase
VEDLEHELQVAIAAARAAGAIHLDRYERLERVVRKSEKDVVTEVDHLSETAILDAIGSAFPDDGVVAEESGATAGQTSRSWVIDPLDGTVNYANGIPFFAVSIGLVEGGVPVLGVVLDPLRAELFSAVRGRGAFLDGQRIRNPGKDRLSDTVVHLGLPRSGFATRYTRFRRAVRITRSMGSATLSLAYVANGRFDAYVQWQGLSPWDVCAAGVIAIEGGAVVTAPSGGAWFEVGMPPRSMGIVAAMPQQHAAFLDMLRSSRDDAAPDAR